MTIRILDEKAQESQKGQREENEVVEGTLGKVLSAHEISKEKRQEKIRSIIDYTAAFFIIFLAFLIALMICFKFWHMVMPISLSWLTDNQLSQINVTFFSSVAGGLIVKYMQKYIQ